MRKLTTFMLLMLASWPLVAQTKIIGRVVDKNNQPMMGVLVTPENGVPVTSDLDGQFEIEVEEGASVTASTSGYKSVSAPAHQDMVIMIKGRGTSEEYPGLKKAWHHFLFVDYGYKPDDKLHALGLTFGQCRKVGWYMSLLVGLELNYSKHGQHNALDRSSDDEYTCNVQDDREIWGTPVFTGEKSAQYVSVDAGLMVRLGIPMYWYCGAGYAYHKYTYKTTGGEWFERKHNWDHNFMYESGLRGNIKGFALSLGIVGIVGPTDSFDFVNKGLMAKVGVGFALPAKKMNERYLAKKGGSK